jgi:hypothetical protein
VLKDKSEYPSFKGWDMIIKKKMEFIIGNHRVKILKEYLYYLKSSKNKQWWIYNIYNKNII